MKFSGHEIMKLLDLPEEALVSEGANEKYYIHTDSRTITADQIFWALPGDNFHGDQFVLSCLKMGSAGAVFETLSDHFTDVSDESRWLIRVENTLSAYQQLGSKARLKSGAKVIGITGSNGKTTTKEMVKHVLSRRFRTVASPKSFNNHVGVPHTLLMLEENTEACVLEIGMNHSGEIKFLAQCALPDIGVILNVSRAHLGHFPDINAIARSKAELIHGTKKQGCLILNAELRCFEDFQNFPDHKVLWFGKNEDGLDLKCLGAIQRQDTLVFQFEDVEGQFEVSFNGLGTHLYENVAACILIAQHMGLTKDEIIEFFMDFKQPGMRMEKITLDNGSVIINDAYNSNPTSAKMAIDSLLSMEVSGRRHLIFGSMEELGLESEKCHAELAEWIGRGNIDYLYLFGDKTWTMKEVLSSHHRIVTNHFSTHEELCSAVSSNLKPGDVMLFKGSRKNMLEKAIFILRGSRF